MDIVTSFKTTPPKEGYFGSYDEVLFALQFDTGVAENVYAKRAKSDVRAALNLPVIMAMQKDVDESYLPVWVDQHTVVLSKDTFPVDKPDIHSISTAGRLLSRTTKMLLASIAATTKDCEEGLKIALIDPLWTRIQVVGKNTYSFSVKQRWAVLDGRSIQ